MKDNLKEVVGEVGYWVFVIVAAILLFSCKSTKPEASATIPPAEVKTTELEKSTSFTKTETLKLDTVSVAADSSKIEGQLTVDPVTKKIKPFKAKSGGKRANATAEVDSAGNLKVKCNCEAERAIIASKDTQISQLTNQKQKSTTVKRIPFPYTAWYDYLARAIALLLTACNLIALIIYLIYRYGKKIQRSGAKRA